MAAAAQINVAHPKTRRFTSRRLSAYQTLAVAVSKRHARSARACFNEEAFDSSRRGEKRRRLSSQSATCERASWSLPPPNVRWGEGASAKRTTVKTARRCSSIKYLYSHHLVYTLFMHIEQLSSIVAIQSLLNSKQTVCCSKSQRGAHFFGAFGRDESGNFTSRGNEMRDVGHNARASLRAYGQNVRGGAVISVAAAAAAATAAAAAAATTIVRPPLMHEAT